MNQKPIAMSEKDNQSPGEEAIADLKKFNPFVFVFCFLIMYVGSLILNSSMTLEQKALPYALCVVFFILAIFAEFYRIEREREFSERIWG